MKWHELCVVANNGYNTVCHDGLTIVFDKNMATGEFNLEVFSALYRKLQTLRDALDGVCIATLDAAEYTEVSEVLMSDMELVLSGKINDIKFFFKNPGKYIHCMIPGYVLNRFVIPGDNMIGIKDGRYVYVDNERFSVVTRRFTI